LRLPDLSKRLTRFYYVPARQKCTLSQ